MSKAKIKPTPGWVLGWHFCYGAPERPVIVAPLGIMQDEYPKRGEVLRKPDDCGWSEPCTSRAYHGSRRLEDAWDYARFENRPVLCLVEVPKRGTTFYHDKFGTLARRILGTCWTQDWVDLVRLRYVAKDMNDRWERAALELMHAQHEMEDVGDE
jgi:hypothetical protein